MPGKKPGKVGLGSGNPLDKVTSSGWFLAIVIAGHIPSVIVSRKLAVVKKLREFSVKIILWKIISAAVRAVVIPGLSVIVVIRIVIGAALSIFIRG